MAFEMHDSPIAFHRAYARLTGSVTAGLLLSQAVYWSKRQPPEREGWFYKTQAGWEEETTMTRYEQEGARRILRKFPFWKEELRGTPSKLWFKVDFDELESCIQGWGKTTSLQGENQHTITKTTAENYSVTNLSQDVDPVEAWIECKLVENPEMRERLELYKHKNSAYREQVLRSMIEKKSLRSLQSESLSSPPFSGAPSPSLRKTVPLSESIYARMGGAPE